MSQYLEEIPESGAVFTFGKSRFADNEPSHFFIKNDPVVAISCGDEHTSVICQQGRVFVFGGNEYGQLGLGHSGLVARPSCVKWLKPQRAAFVACGRAHTIFVTDNNTIYTAGNNADGQLGTGATEDHCVPQYIELECENSRIKQVSAGSNHTAILTESGQVFVCGSNSDGQLGLGEDVKNCLSLTEVNFMESIAFVECGYYHTVFITAKGAVFICGENESQKLGTGNSAVNIYVPQLLPIATPIKSACCGANHTFLLSMDETKIFAFGSNEQGQLGLPQTVVDVTVPTEMSLDKMFDGYPLKLVACGATHTAFVTDNGLLYTCGEARHDKLCYEIIDNDTENGNPTKSQFLPKRVTMLNGFVVDNVACGGCHTIVAATKGSNFDLSNNDFRLVNDTTRSSSISTELPPLQKVPIAIWPRNNTEEGGMIDSQNIKKSGEIEGSSEDEKHIHHIKANENPGSMDSLEANVSGSHIINMNDFENSDSMQTNMIPKKESSEGSNTEKTLSPQMTVEETEIERGIVSKPGENCDECANKVSSVSDSINTDLNSSLPMSQITGNQLRLPTVPKMSPDKSTNSEVSQKSDTYSKSENETIVCCSDKSSPQNTKTAKTQAVMPILRSEDSIEKEIIDEPEMITESASEKGRLSNFFQKIRDKENSCMGRGKVIENVVVESVEKTIKGTEDTIHKIEETVVHEIHNQTNSRTCTIL